MTCPAARPSSSNQQCTGHCNSSLHQSPYCCSRLASSGGMEGAITHRSSAKVDGRAIKEVPVSRMTPVLSSSAVASPKVMASRSTSQYALRLNGILVILPV